MLLGKHSRDRIQRELGDGPITGRSEKWRSSPRVEEMGQPGKVTENSESDTTRTGGGKCGVLILGIAPGG
jgi:hypothetical protein